MKKTGAVIVAAGCGKEAFQPFLPVGDSTVIRRLVITLKRAGINPVVVVTGYQGDKLEKHLSGLGVICLRNERYEETQMFYSICMGLRYIETLAEQVLVMPVKFPMLLLDTIELLLNTEAEAAAPVYGGQKGHPVLISSSRIGQILAYEGEEGLGGALLSAQREGWLQEVPVEDEGVVLAVESDHASAALEGERIDIHVQIQLCLGRDGIFFDSVTAQFLQLIDHTGSMQTACRQMHMSYTKGWQLLKYAERQLGFPLLNTHSGGAEGGFSRLTPEAVDFLERYLQMERELNEAGERLFGKLFQQKGAV